MNRTKQDQNYWSSNRIRSIRKMAKIVALETVLSVVLAVLAWLLSLEIFAVLSLIPPGLGLLFLLVLGLCYWMTITRRIPRSKMWAFLKFLEKWPMRIYRAIVILFWVGLFFFLGRISSSAG